MLKGKTVPFLCLILAVSLVGLGISRGVLAKNRKPDKYQWYRELSDGHYKQALALAPNREHVIDTHFRLASDYENKRSFREAFETYKQILEEYPDTPYAAEINYKLGHICFYYSREVFLGDTSFKARKREDPSLSEWKFSRLNSQSFFEEAIRRGQRLDYSVLLSRWSLVEIYHDFGRRDEAYKIANDIAGLDIYDVTTADYRGPFAQYGNGEDYSYSERLDSKRKRLLEFRGMARRTVLSMDENRLPTDIEVSSFPAKRDKPPAISVNLPNPLPFVEHPIDAEITPLIEGIKSAEENVRESAVAELLGLRQCVAEELIRIVDDANRGVLNDHSKAVALSLMGSLRLLQCKETLEKEKEWEYRVSSTIDRDMRNPIWDIVGNPAERALSLGRFTESVSLTAWRGKVSLSRYPALKHAFELLRTSEWQSIVAVNPCHSRAAFEDWYGSVLCEGVDYIHRWDQICSAVTHLLDMQWNGYIYSDDVRCTAAFVAGEYRAEYDRELLEYIDLKDVNGVCAKYDRTMEVQTCAQDYPCVIALVKARCQETVDFVVANIHFRSGLSTEARARILRLALEIEREAVESEFRAQLRRYRQPECEGLTEEVRLKHHNRLVELEAIEPLMNAGAIP